MKLLKFVERLKTNNTSNLCLSEVLFNQTNLIVTEKTNLKNIYIPLHPMICVALAAILESEKQVIKLKNLAIHI